MLYYIKMTSNKSPLRYPGGKSRACKIIDDVISTHFDISKYNTLLSPFFGGGSFEFYFQNRHGYNIIANDKFTPLYNFWKQVKNNKKILCSELKKNTIISKEQFVNYRNTIMNMNNEIQQAMQYFIINRCSFSGATLSGGFSEEASKKRYTLSSIDRIELLDLSNIEFYNLDFEKFISTHYDDERCLMFLDPPYFLEKNSRLYGNNGDMHELFDHQLLFDTIKTKKNWIITYNNCEYIKKLYNNFKIIEVNWSYGMNTTKKSSEIIILFI